MKRKSTEHRKMELNMTSMIDVVFLLLVFFVMTFRIVAPEGDFNVKMPPAGRPPEPQIDLPPESVQVVLKATPEGELASIRFGERPVGDFEELRACVLQSAGIDETTATSPLEIELVPDDHLRYEYVIRAITAVFGEVRDGQIHKICDKIRFAPRPRGG